jgi:replication fork clamp-binding protein CrfC
VFVENKPAKPTTQNAPAVNTHHAKIKIRGGSRRAVSQQNVVAAVTRKSMNAAWALCHRSIHTTRVINDERTERRRNSAGQPVGAGLIPMINQLQAIFAMIGTELDLPQIVVIGSQSAGKSSVLENLVGRDFLPRGSGVVTRRPLILQLTRTTDGQEYAEFLHKPNTKYTNFDMVRLEIEAETDRRAGKNKGLSAEPILLKIFSPNVLNLTLVDTPGITRIPMGDQPPDIEDQIRNMIRGFISKNNAIILAVTAANQDLSTSDALKLAKEADPEGARTIGVLTKLDLMDRGTDAVPILMGRHLPLTHGWIGLVNRSQLDINSQKTIARSLQDEMDYFGNHPAYKLLNDRTGTGVLGERCSRLLTDHIRKTLPKLRAQISELIKQRRAELEAYGEPTVTDSPAAKGWQVLQLLNKFSQDFRAAIDGVPADIETKELNGGARIRYIFNESFMSRLAEINATTGLSTSDIRTAIRNAAGPKPALFVPEKAFEQLVKRQIELLREPALSVVEQGSNQSFIDSFCYRKAQCLIFVLPC